MRTMRKYFGKILVLLIACLTIGGVVNAAESISTEVQIAVEASETSMASGTNNNQRMTGANGVQTGDKTNMLGYLLAAGTAIGLVAFCVFKKKKGMIAVFAMFLSLLFMNHSVYAAEGTKNINVTIPSSISVCFDENGENSISEFAISNQSLVPISVKNVKVTECNNWKLCNLEDTIPIDTKQMAFTFEGQCLKSEDNLVDITIKENTSKNCDIQIVRGAWTTSEAKETALQLEFEYTIGQKEFQLTFDANGSNLSFEMQKVSNGEIITLPSPTRDRYEFAGWEDAEGNLYTEQFVMPIGDIELKAKWRETVAYAIHFASDSSLRFVRSAKPITVGSTYDGKTVTGVYTGFETATYSSESQVPWYDGDYYNKTIVTKVIVEDVIQPVSTAHWFHWMYDCESIDVQKLDTSKVRDMSYMFGWAGFSATNFELKGINDFDVSNVNNMSYTFGYTGRDANKVVMDLSKWNVSKVTNMSYMFAGTGYFSTTFALGDLSKWDVANVTNMSSMFRQTGYYANWYVNCSNWNVNKVTSYRSFNLEVASKAIEPRWVN